MPTYDKIIIGAGMYGLYAAMKCGKAGQHILVLEYDNMPFSRASYINQARVHMGYHYPRSLSTAKKSANYYRRFHEDFGFAINDQFKQFYATSATFSWSNREAFKRFCEAARIKCREVEPTEFFMPGTCDGAFLTEEDSYDASIMRSYFVDELAKLSNVEVYYNVRVDRILRTSKDVSVEYHMSDKKTIASSSFLLNATYASTNQILNKISDEAEKKGDYKKFGVKYEQCEIILCRVNDRLKKVGLTVMDGPFFSIMPFGKTPFHSLTSVTFTPHVTSYEELPTFSCQDGASCSPEQLENCNECSHKPKTAWEHMSHLARKYMIPEFEFSYVDSLYSMKPILKSSEIDDSRPTTIVVNSKSPTILSVLSGKINTIYDLDDYLEL